MSARLLLGAFLAIVMNPCFAFFGTVEDHALLLTSDDPIEIREGAQSAYKLFGGNRILNDIAAKRLLQALDQSKPLDDYSVAWLARAVGGSGSLRYREVLQKTVALGPGRAKYWATLGLRRSQVEAGLFEADQIDIAAIRKELLDAAPITNTQVRAKLSSTNAKLARQTAERMYYLSSILDDQTLNDAAEFIRSHLHTKDERNQAASWLCRLLGKTGREQDVEVLAHAATEGKSKLKKHAKESLALLKKKLAK